MKKKERKSFVKIIESVVGLCLIAPFLVLILSMVSSDKAAYKADTVLVDEDYDRKFTGVQVKMENSLSWETYTSGLTYRINTANMEACVSIGSATSETSIVIPTSYVDGSSTYTITAVDYSGFVNNTVMTSFVFNTPANITLIDAQAFAGDINLSMFNSTTSGSFVIPENLTQIYPDTFYGNAAMTSLSFGKNLITSIGSNAFADCVALASAPQFKIATGLTIGDSAFANCIVLPNILLPSKVTSIGKCAFYNCYTAHFITIPSSCTSIGKDAFRLCTNAKAYIGSSSRYPTGWPSDGTDSGSDTIGTGSVTVNDWNYGTSSYAIPIKTNCDNVTINGNYIYTCSWNTDYGKENSNTGIYLLTIIEYTGSETSISIPKVLPAQTDGTHYNTDMNDTSGNQYGIVYIIAENAFNFASSVSSLTIPSTVYEIEYNGFCGWGMTQVSTLTLTDVIDSPSVTVGSNTTLLSAIGIPGLTYIDKCAFSYSYYYGSDDTTPSCAGNSNLTSLTIPSTVQEIGYAAFYGFTYVRTLTFTGAEAGNGSLKTIGNYAFYNLGNSVSSSTYKGVLELYIPKSTTYIGDYSFYGCTLLKGVVVGSGGEASGTIGQSSFQGCTRMVYADFGNGFTTMESNVFNGNTMMEWIFLYRISSFGTDDFNACAILTIYSHDTITTTLRNGASSYFVLGDDANYATQYFRYNVPLEAYHPVNKPASPTYSTKSCIPVFSGLSGAYPYDQKTIAQNYVITDTTNGYQYYSTDGATCTLSKYLQYIGKTSISITGSLNNWSVTAIGDCFAMSAYYCNLKSYSVIPLTSVRVPDTLVSIGKNAFFGCTSLTDFYNGTSYTFPTALTSVDDYAFFHTILSKIILGANVSSIGDLAFSYNTVLKAYSSSGTSSNTLTVSSSNTHYLAENNALYEITGTNTYKFLSFTGTYYSSGTTIQGVLTIKDGTTEIGSNSIFASKIYKIVLPDSVTKIDDYGFTCYLCTSTTTSVYTSDFQQNSSVVSDYYKYGYITTISLNSRESSLLAYIGRCGFYCQTSVTSIDLPDNSAVYGLYIGKYTFRVCCLLETLTFPTYSETIKHYVDDQESVVYSTSNTNYNQTTFVYNGGSDGFCSLSDYMFDRAEHIGYSNSTSSNPFTLPGCINRIGKICFWGCKYLKYVKLEGIKVIDEQAFQKCSNLKIVTLDEGTLQEIEASAFSGCSNMMSINLNNQDKLSKIGSNAFASCTSLSSTLNLSNCDGGGATLIIESNAFSGCNQITTINFNGSTNLNQINSNAFDGTKASSFDFTGCTGLATIGDSAFNGLSKYLTTISFSGCTGLSTVGASAFASLLYLQSVDFSGCTSLNSLGASCFSGDTSLTTVTISGLTSLITLNSSCFAGCTSLSSLSLSGCTGLKTLGASCFSGCTSLSTLTLTNCTSVNSIGESCFSGCNALINFDISALTGLTSGLGKNAFENCLYLKTVTFPTTLTAISNYCFKGDTALTGVSNITNVTSIGLQAFSVCTSIASFEVPGKTTSIGKNAFDGCTSLVTLSFASGTANLTISDYAFNGCTALKGTSATSNLTYGGSSVTAFILPDRTYVLGANVFNSCSSISYIYLPSTINKVGTALFTGCSSSIKIFVNVAYSTFITSGGNYQGDSHWLESWSLGFLTNRYFYSASAPLDGDWEAVGNNALAGFFYGTISTGISLYTQ